MVALPKGTAFFILPSSAGFLLRGGSEMRDWKIPLTATASQIVEALDEWGGHMGVPVVEQRCLWNYFVALRGPDDGDAEIEERTTVPIRWYLRNFAKRVDVCVTERAPYDERLLELCQVEASNPFFRHVKRAAMALLLMYHRDRLRSAQRHKSAPRYPVQIDPSPVGQRILCHWCGEGIDFGLGTGNPEYTEIPSDAEVEDDEPIFYQYTCGKCFPIYGFRFWESLIYRIRQRLGTADDPNPGDLLDPVDPPEILPRLLAQFSSRQVILWWERTCRLRVVEKQVMEEQGEEPY